MTSVIRIAVNPRPLEHDLATWLERGDQYRKRSNGDSDAIGPFLVLPTLHRIG